MHVARHSGYIFSVEQFVPHTYICLVFLLGSIITFRVHDCHVAYNELIKAV